MAGISRTDHPGAHPERAAVQAIQAVHPDHRVHAALPVVDHHLRAGAPALCSTTAGLVNTAAGTLGLERDSVPERCRPTGWPPTWPWASGRASAGTRSSISRRSPPSTPSCTRPPRWTGRGDLRRMWHVTLPGIRSTIVVMLIIRLGHILGSEFDRPYALGNALVTNRLQRHRHLRVHLRHAGAAVLADHGGGAFPVRDRRDLPVAAEPPREALRRAGLVGRGTQHDHIAPYEDRRLLVVVASASSSSWSVFCRYVNIARALPQLPRMALIRSEVVSLAEGLQPARVRLRPRRRQVHVGARLDRDPDDRRHRPVAGHDHDVRLPAHVSTSSRAAGSSSTLIIFTMFFNAGTIPTYLLLKDLT